MIEVYNMSLERPRADKIYSMGRYIVKSFTETSSPEEAIIAQKVQAESYRESGYVEETAVSEGKLLSEVDKSRGKDVVYYLGYDIEQKKSMASLRRKFIPNNGSLDDLSGFKDSQPVLFDGVEDELRQHINAYGQDSVSEICALGKTVSAPSSLSVRLIGAAIRDVYESQSNEKWIVLFAKPAYESINKLFGPSIVRQAGDLVDTVSGDEHVSSSLTFMPCVVDPGKIYDTLAEELYSDKLDKREYMARSRTLRLISEGLDTSGMSKATADMITFLNNKEKSA